VLKWNSSIEVHNAQLQSFHFQRQAEDDTAFQDREELSQPFSVNFTHQLPPFNDNVILCLYYLHARTCKTNLDRHLWVANFLSEFQKRPTPRDTDNSAEKTTIEKFIKPTVWHSAN